MDEAITHLWSLGSLVLAMVIVIATFMIRKIVETAVPTIKKKADENSPAITYETPLARWWDQVILHLIPEVIGAGIGFFPSTFLFGEQIQTMGSRMLYGVVIAWFSGATYKILRKTLAAKAGIELPNVGSNDVVDH